MSHIRSDNLKSILNKTIVTLSDESTVIIDNLFSNKKAYIYLVGAVLLVLTCPQNNSLKKWTFVESNLVEN